MVVGLNPEPINGRELSAYEYSEAGVMSGRLVNFRKTFNFLFRYHDSSDYSAFGCFEDSIPVTRRALTRENQRKIHRRLSVN